MKPTSKLCLLLCALIVAFQMGRFSVRTRTIEWYQTPRWEYSTNYPNKPEVDIVTTNVASHEDFMCAYNKLVFQKIMDAYDVGWSYATTQIGRLDGKAVLIYDYKFLTNCP